MADSPSDATVLFRALGGGDARAVEMFPVVYDRLRGLAAEWMSREAGPHTLQPTALVHEAWLRLIDEKGERWANPAYFFGAAAEAMRRILIEHARWKKREKHGGGLVRVSLVGIDVPGLADAEPEDLDRAIEALAAVDSRAAELGRLRVYAGLGVVQAAQVMGISPATVKREWKYARAWLRDRLEPGA